MSSIEPESKRRYPVSSVTHPSSSGMHWRVGSAVQDITGWDNPVVATYPRWRFASTAGFPDLLVNA